MGFWGFGVLAFWRETTLPVVVPITSGHRRNPRQDAKPAKNAPQWFEGLAPAGNPKSSNRTVRKRIRSPDYRLPSTFGRFPVTVRRKFLTPCFQPVVRNATRIPQTFPAIWKRKVGPNTRPQTTK